ncbi:MAG: MSMEG_6728 family protein [Frankiaceae bacterium]
MQTFLPFPSLLASAVTLDDRRLGKQRVEAFQILRALVFPTYGWKNHPAVAMWRGFTPALVGYGLTICREWERRGYADAVAGALLEFTGGAVSDLGALRIEGRRRPGSAPRRCMHRIGRRCCVRIPITTARCFPQRWPCPLSCRTTGLLRCFRAGRYAAQADSPQPRRWRRLDSTTSRRPTPWWPLRWPGCARGTRSAWRPPRWRWRRCFSSIHRPCG